MNININHLLRFTLVTISINNFFFFKLRLYFLISIVSPVNNFLIEHEFFPLYLRLISKIFLLHPWKWYILHTSIIRVSFSVLKVLVSLEITMIKHDRHWILRAFSIFSIAKRTRMFLKRFSVFSYICIRRYFLIQSLSRTIFKLLSNRTHRVSL